MYLFTGRGVELPQEKEPALSSGIVTLPLAKEMEIPLFTLGKTELALTVGMGKTVQKYAPLAVSPSRNHAIASPVTGRVMGVRTRSHPLLGRVPCAVLQPDPSGRPAKVCAPWEKKMDFDHIVQAAKAAGIVDEVDGRPLYRKMRELKEGNANLLIASALDDEPYVSSGLATLLEQGTEVSKGLELLRWGAPGAILQIAVYDPGKSKPLQSLPKAIREAEVQSIRGNYPIWPALQKKWRCQTIMRFGVQACAALSRAVYEGKAQVDIIVTVAGNAVEHPRNVCVPVGTPIAYLLEQCGAQTAQWVSIGSPMTGRLVQDQSVPVTAGMRCLLAQDQLKWKKNASCIGCGRCIQVCPQRLRPYQIAQLYERGEPEQAARFGAARCIGCGACSAVCPAGVELTAIMRRTIRVSAAGDWGKG